MLSKVYGGSVLGVNANLITVETSTTNGSKIRLVGLPDKAIQEATYRIEAALKNSGYRKPGKQITINLAPADQKKEGASYDLTIAIGILATSDQLETTKLDKYLVLGELSLDGSLNPINGSLPIAIMAREKGFKGIILPKANAHEAAIVNDIDVYGFNNINEVVGFLIDAQEFTPTKVDTRELFSNNTANSSMDFSEVKGQANIKRAMEIAAAGGHNLIIIGVKITVSNNICLKY